MIDFRSDTVTKPTKDMLDYMFAAKVGDDVFNEDPSILKLEEYAAQLFQMEAGIFCPSGTMTNQIAIKAHTIPGDEVICHETSHIYQYEGGGIAVNSGCSVKLLQSTTGKITPDQIDEAINPDDIHKPVSKLLSIENTANRAGGVCYSIEEMKALKTKASECNLIYHLDGARLFNALVAQDKKPADCSGIFDSISICLSKGLGAPVGSLLLGKRELITKARRIRKVFGGGMRQAGYLAAAGYFALHNHVDRLKADHKHAQLLVDTLDKLNVIQTVYPVETNIVIVDLKPEINTKEWVEKLAHQDIHVIPMGPKSVRFVTHLEITSEMISKTKEVLESIDKEY